ncbi:hypothetical protein LTR84_004782 [Exophiala bonariae]|uniref:Uncharacterized protein n=1 Tax=Exophiala bonariae TaxID=1690606 RepID=A0AAV9NNI3_9EURO|nr:hypothetical protein LTR84_004782 [Exophiala bonariae]
MSYEYLLGSEDFWVEQIKQTECEFEEARIARDRKQAEVEHAQTELDRTEKELAQKMNERDQKRIELKQKHVRLSQNDIEIDKKTIHLNYAKNRLYQMRKQRQSLEAFTSLDQGVRQLGIENKTTQANPTPIKATTVQSGAFSDEESKFTTTSLSRGGRPSALAAANHTLDEHNNLNPSASRHDEKSNQIKVQSRDSLLSTFIKPRTSLIVTLRYRPQKKPVSTEISPMLQKRIRGSRPTEISKKRPREMVSSETKADYRITKARRLELQDEMVELDSMSTDEPATTKRKRPEPGRYQTPDVMLSPFMARLCHPVVKIFKTALRRVKSANSHLRRAFDTLGEMVETGDLKPGEEFWEWAEKTKDIIAVSNLCYGADKGMLLSRLQRWIDQCDDCMFSCEYELEDEYERREAVDRSVQTLQREFASLAEDVLPIVRSDIR